MTHGFRDVSGTNQSWLPMGCKLLVLLSLALLALLWSNDADCVTLPAGFADIGMALPVWLSTLLVGFTHGNAPDGFGFLRTM